MLRVSTALAFSALLVSSLPAAAADTAKTSRSPRTSRRSSSRSASRAIGRTTWRRCRCITYEEARPWAKSIASRVGARQMPPWHIDKTDRHPEVQERSVAERRSDRHDPRVGRRRRAEGRSEGHARAESLEGRDRAGAWRTSTAQPDLVVKSPDYTMPPVAQDAWWRPSNADRHHRAALGPRDRDPPGRQERAQDHAPRARAPAAAGRHGPGALHQRSERRRRRPLHGVGGRQERRRDASRLGPPDAARTRRSCGRCTITRSARRSPTHTELGRLVLPEGPGAEAPRSARAVQHVLGRGPRRPLARHPAERGDDDRELRDAEAERPHRELPGAHAPARQGHVDGSDLSRTAAARC